MLESAACGHCLPRTHVQRCAQEVLAAISPEYLLSKAAVDVLHFTVEDELVKTFSLAHRIAAELSRRRTLGAGEFSAAANILAGRLDGPVTASGARLIQERSAEYK